MSLLYFIFYIHILYFIYIFLIIINFPAFECDKNRHAFDVPSEYEVGNLTSEALQP